MPCTSTNTLNSQRQSSVGSLSEDAGVVTPSQSLMENHEVVNSQIQFYPNDFCSIIFFRKQIGIPTSFPRSVYTMQYGGSTGWESDNDRNTKTQNMFGENWTYLLGFLVTQSLWEDLSLSGISLFLMILSDKESFWRNVQPRTQSP